MIIRIIRFPNFPVLEEIPEKLIRQLDGMIAQARKPCSTYYGWNKEDSDFIIGSLSLKKNERPIFVDECNIIAVVLDNRELGKLFLHLNKSFSSGIKVMNRIPGLFFSPSDVEILFP